jgi:hypothetical protein
VQRNKQHGKEKVADGSGEVKQEVDGGGVRFEYRSNEMKVDRFSSLIKHISTPGNQSCASWETLTRARESMRKMITTLERAVRGKRNDLCLTSAPELTI